MLTVEIADNPFKQANGLMFRRSMPDDNGMIFVFKKPDKLRFWGVNTYIPLDIAFVNHHKKIMQISHVKPLSDKTVVSDYPCCIAIEANAGWFEKNKICVGDKIEFETASEREGIVRFSKVKTAQQMISKPGKQTQTPPPIKDDTGQPIQPVKPQQPTIQPQTQPEQNAGGLPVINESNLASILEDSFDDSGDEGVANPDMDPNQMQQPQMEPQNEEQEAPEDFEIPDEEDYPEFGSTTEALHWAQNNHEVIRIWYTTKGGRDIEREVEPHGEFQAKSTNNQIAVVFDETVGDIRAFIISNIMYYTFVGKEFQPKFVVQG